MILGYLIVGMVTGVAMSLLTLMAGWGIGVAMLTYCAGGAVSVLLLGMLAFALPKRHEQGMAQPRHSSV